MSDKKKLLNISEAAIKIGLINKKSNKPSTHTLRFWETKLKKIRPVTLGGNRRFYTEQNIQTLKLISFLLKDQKLTISGAQKILNKNINTLDDFKSSSIKALYFKENLRSKTKLLLNKINKLKK